MKNHLDPLQCLVELPLVIQFKKPIVHSGNHKPPNAWASGHDPHALVVCGEPIGQMGPNKTRAAKDKHIHTTVKSDAENPFFNQPAAGRPWMAQPQSHSSWQ